METTQTAQAFGLRGLCGLSEAISLSPKGREVEKDHTQDDEYANNDAENIDYLLGFLVE